MFPHRKLPKSKPMKPTDFFNRTQQEPEHKIRRRTFFSFFVFVLANAGGIAAWKWLNRQPLEKGALQPLRNTLQTNEQIFSGAFSPHRLAKTYSPADAAKHVRVNGKTGLHHNINGDEWQLNVMKPDGSRQPVSLADIRALPKQDIVFDFKCIEGWSQVQHWSGVPLATFLSAFHLQEYTQKKFIGLLTPDKKYYVGIDMQSALHPQTMLCYEMNGAPLTPEHGFPLRLIIPVKYGIKNLKCIGFLYFSDRKPPDYWAERGYDYYAGL